ncbi:MAG: SDR family NAD(P)-dependent oxidoreductase, partial [Oscillospiraceae bacterium]
MRTVLITGGSRGIGAACVRAFWGAGWRVAFCYVQARAQALALEKECPGVLALSGDVACAADALRLVQEAERANGPLDLLINNAGISLHGLLQDTDEADFDRLFAVNVKGTFLCCRAALPGMIRRQTGGILNLSSMWGQVGGSCEVAYSASKAAVIGLTRALAREVGPSGIRVNCIAPGVIDTEMNAALDAK